MSSSLLLELHRGEGGEEGELFSREEEKKKHPGKRSAEHQRGRREREERESKREKIRGTTGLTRRENLVRRRQRKGRE